MKVQSFLILCLVAGALAVPNIRHRRADNSTTGADCDKSQGGGLTGLLSQVGNLLSNLLVNVGKIRIAGLLGGQGDLINLTNLLTELRSLLVTLLGGNQPADSSENEGLLSDLIGRITALLDNLLGNGTGKKYACNNSGGLVGGLLQSLIDTLQGVLTGGGSGSGLALGPLVNELLQLVGNLLNALL